MELLFIGWDRIIDDLNVITSISRRGKTLYHFFHKGRAKLTSKSIFTQKNSVGVFHPTLWESTVECSSKDNVFYQN